MRLNLGCGNDIRKGWINLDQYEHEGVDVIHDLNELPLPFEDDSFNFILCKNLLEHINYIPLMNELQRILKKNGRVYIRVPHFTSKSNYADPTHINMFSTKTFFYFVKTSKYSYERNLNLFSSIKIKIQFEKSNVFLLKNFLNFFEKWVNKSNRHQFFYERSFLRIIPALAIQCVLIK